MPKSKNRKQKVKEKIYEAMPPAISGGRLVQKSYKELRKAAKQEAKNIKSKRGKPVLLPVFAPGASLFKKILKTKIKVKKRKTKKRR